MGDIGVEVVGGFGVGGVGMGAVGSEVVFLLQ
jgi:lactate dehydrogenase-like 2-hydroxyacid dehydrogenase